jgi:hypothetical protein
MDPVMSRPVRMFWAGWETDTHKLQKAGWALSAEQDPFRGSLRLAMRHVEHGWRGLTETRDWRHATEYDPAVYHNPDRWPWLRADLAHQFSIVQTYPLASRFRPEVEFAPIDATPQARKSEPKTFDEYCHFARLDRQHRIILPEESVPKLLERILELQQPARAERIRKEVRDERFEKLTHHAQILSFPAAA